MKTILMASAIALTATAAMATPTLTVKMSEAGFADNVFSPGSAKKGVTTSTDGNAVSYGGGYGDFAINFTSGQTGTGPTSINLNSLDTSAKKFKGSRTLTLAITLTDITTPVGMIEWLSTFSGTLGKNSTATFASYLDRGNAAFGTAVALSHLSCLTPSNQKSCSNGSDQVPATGVAPYSITEIVTLTTVAGTQNNINATLSGTAVPEPASMALLGAGLAGLGLVRRARRA